MYIRKRKQKNKRGGQDVDGVELSEPPELLDNKYLKDKSKIINK